MKIHTGCLVALALLSAGCDQPENKCEATRLPYGAKFVKTGGDDACRVFGPYLQDIVGVQTYNPVSSDGSTPDTTTAFIAIKAFTLQAAIHGTADAYGVGDPDSLKPATDPAARKFFALGDFASVDPAEEFCSVPAFRTAAEYSSAAEVPPVTCGTGGGGGAGGGGVGGAGVGGAPPECVEDPGFPKVDIKYEWSAFQMIERADAAGTAFEAKLNYTENTTFGGTATPCNAQYTVIAVAPSVDCSIYDPETGAPTGPDKNLCLPEADVAAGRPVGSGLNPKLTPIIDCIDAGPILGFQCALTVNTIAEVKSQLESASAAE